MPATPLGAASRLLVALLVPALAAAQTLRTIPAEVSCPSCRIVATKLATLTHDIESADRVSNGDAVMDGRGRIYMVSDWRRWQLDVFDSTGRFLKHVGGRGAGPGEFNSIRNIMLGGADTVFVTDDANGRRSTISPRTLEVVRSMPWKPRGLAQLQEVGKRRWVGANRTFSPSRAIRAVQVVDDSGKVVLAVDGGPDSTRPPGEFGMWRSVSADAAGGFYAAHSSVYRIDHWSSSGKLLETFERHVPWFPTRAEADPPPPRDRGGVPYLDVIRADENGYLWVMLRVRDARWKSALIDVRDEDGHLMKGVGDLNRYDDTIVEVLDTKTGRIVATQRFDEAYIRFLRPGYVMSATDEPEPTVTIWHIRLEQPQKTRPADGGEPRLLISSHILSAAELRDRLRAWKGKALRRR